MAKIKNIKAREILDSRGNPTIEVEVRLEDETVSRAQVPSGASVGAFEAVEMRDGDEKRYGGKGVLKAVNNVNELIAKEIIGLDSNSQENIDNAMIDLDDRENKSSLGANGILGISLAVCRAASQSAKIPLYQYISDTFDFSKEDYEMPIPIFNILNGGAHSDSGLSIQEFQVIPVGLYSFSEQLRSASEIFHSLKKILQDNDYRSSVGDEGGFAPKLESHEEAFEMIVSAINHGEYVLGVQIALGIDAASNYFYSEAEENYTLKPEGTSYVKEGLVDLYKDWMDKFEVIAIEDGLQELDWEGWTLMNKRILDLSDKLQQEETKSEAQKSIQLLAQNKYIIGDDLLATNKKRLEEALEKEACNTMIIKPNQVGTLTETIECIKLAKENGIRTIVSHRSGETTDDFIADLAVACRSNFIKTGAPSRGERICKYNRLLEIEKELTSE